MVATIALILALGGGAVYAASRINGKTIKKSSTPGNRLKPDSVTGTQVKEARLGQVPLAHSAEVATSADAATTADSVGGVTEHVVRASLPSPAVGFVDAVADTTAGMQSILRCQADGTSGIVVAGSAPNDRGVIEGVASGGGGPYVPLSVNFSNSAGGVATNGLPITIGGSATMRAVSGAEVRFDFQVYESLDGFGTNDDCFVDGFVRSAP